MLFIDRKHLALLNKTVKLEDEILRLENLCIKLKSDINSTVKQNELVCRFKSDFYNESKFIDFIKENVIERIDVCEYDGIFVEYRKKESDDAFNKMKQKIQEKLDKITSHLLPFNRKKLHDAMLELMAFENNKN